METETSDIAEFYEGRTVFITGASGFMGKVLLEKLLFRCPGIKRVYVLLRSKRGTSPVARLESVFKLPLFERLRRHHHDRLQKVITVEGDVSEEDLGLSPTDRSKLIDEVSVVFHCAASLRLEGKLKELVNINLRGTLRVLQLCEEMKQMKLMLHLSTAFCHVDVTEMEEKIYSCDINPEEIMRLTSWMDESSLDVVTPRLLGPHPNCYTYTKRLAETLVDNHRGKVPVAIARPSIVTPAWKDPLPGWVDNLNGPMGLLVGGGKGVIRTMHCRGDYHAEVVPVDFAINALISFSHFAATKYETNHNNATPVLNVTQNGIVNPMTWSEILDRGKAKCHENPFEMMLWYPDGNIHANWLVHTICAVLFHWVPAYLIDLLMIIFQQKTFMVRVQRRIHEGLNVLQYFTTKEWKFNNANLHRMVKSMTERDRQLFPINVVGLDLDDYLRDCILGARQHLMKEDPATLPRQRRIIKLLYVLDRAVALSVYVFLVWTAFGYAEALARMFMSGQSTVLAPFANPIKVSF